VSLSPYFLVRRVEAADGEFCQGGNAFRRIGFDDKWELGTAILIIFLLLTPNLVR